jgi:hypothetical protein
LALKNSDIITEILPLTADDKKIMLKFLWLMYKIFCGIMFATFILSCFAADWKTKGIQIVLFYGWLPSVLVVHLLFFIWFFYVKNQFKYPFKMVISGVVKDTYVHRGRYPQFYVYLGEKREEFLITKAYDWPNNGFEKNDFIALHYILKSQDKLGSLIKVEKLNA